MPSPSPPQAAEPAYYCSVIAPGREATLDALEWVGLAITAGAEPRAVLAEHLPWLVEAIQADAAASRFDRWGLSTVRDELAGVEVLPESLFAELHRLAGLPSNWPVGNAGLLHVYGYLLSTTPTPFGLKRDRWTRGETAAALGLPAEEFAPWGAGGGAGSEPGAGTPLERVASAMAGVLAAPTVASGVLLWLEESTAEGSIGTTVIVGHGGGRGALLYSVDGALLTIFPLAAVTPEWVDALLAEAPRLRYNAVARAPRGNGLSGREAGRTVEATTIRLRTL